MKPGLIDLLACPVCHGNLTLAGDGESLTCAGCGRVYPVRGGVPVLLPEGEPTVLAHMVARQGYYPWIHRHVLTALPQSARVLDLGAGDMGLNHPNIVRMDVFLSPHVDVVGDAHALPFRADAFDFAFSLAVLEHLRQPFTAAAEMHRVLRPGGQVYADTNFVFPHHGYPHHYFNFSRTGIETVFAPFHRLDSGVPPYLMPAWAVIHLINAYLDHFGPAHSPTEVDFVQTARRLLDHDLHAFDRRFPPDVAHIFSAGVHFYGQKRPGSLLPPAFRATWARRPDLQAEFPEPEDLSGNRPSLLNWAATFGRREEPEIDAALAADPLIDPASLWDDARPPLRRGETYPELAREADRLRERLTAVDAARNAATQRAEAAEAELATTRAELGRVASGRVLRLLNRLHRWRRV